MIRLLIAPDSFKGSLTSVEVAAALADGWSRARPGDELRLAPLSDGGDGLLDAVQAAGGWRPWTVPAHDPIGRGISARFLRAAADGGRAVVEMAEASGLARVAPVDRDPLGASTFGTGQLLAGAVEAGCRDIVLGLGGSATNDGGTGLLRALGARFLDEAGAELRSGGAALAGLAHVDLSRLPATLAEVSLTVASDVANPLLGATGAAATYGPQKGASPAQVRRLEAALTRYAEVLEAAVGRPLRDTPGAGAAGGTGFGLLAIADRWRSFAVRPGVEVVMELTGFDTALATVELVLTGEGRVDAQTAHGKTALGVARRARAAGVRCLCFAGGATPEGIRVLAEAGAIVVPVSEAPGTVEAAMAAGAAPLARAAERTAGLIGLLPQTRT